MCKYCERPHYEITLPCIGGKITDYPKTDKENWVVVKLKYKCPQCGTIWTQENFYHAE